MTNNISFRCPVHHSPGAISHAFTYEPYVSLKIDGVFFEELNTLNHDKYFPIFPQSWTKIEGECYHPIQNKIYNKPPIYYIFYIQCSDKTFMSISEMYEEIENYFLSQILANSISFDISDTADITDIRHDILNNINLSFKWRDQQSMEANGLIWFPKKYWKLNASSWNTYIEQLDSIFKFVNTTEIKQLIAHDGLIISPNIPSNKKSLVKLKPKEDLTIDLFFNGRDFFSKERTSYKNIIGKYNFYKIEHNCVYRLAPDKYGKYIPVYKRENNKKPNPNSIIEDILYKYNNYFEIIQLRDIYINPWYDKMIPDKLNEVTPLFEYVQNIYNTILPQMNYGIVFDIGCGSMGQYHKHFMTSYRLEKYIGLDIDLAKLHEAQVKVKYDTRFSFVLMNIEKKWGKQNDFFPNNIWKTYYHNLVKLGQKADNIISIFSSQYANLSPETWNNYIGEINYRSKIGTKLFIMWIDCSKINSVKTTEYYSYDSTTNLLTVNLPHRIEHKEYGLGNQIFESFNNNSDNKNKWIIDNTISVNNIVIDDKINIFNYAKLINYKIFVKI
jgi:hypothetical protein